MLCLRYSYLKGKPSSTDWFWLRRRCRCNCPSHILCPSHTLQGEIDLPSAEHRLFEDTDQHAPSPSPDVAEVVSLFITNQNAAEFVVKGTVASPPPQTIHAQEDGNVERVPGVTFEVEGCRGPGTLCKKRPVWFVHVFPSGRKEGRNQETRATLTDRKRLAQASRI